jgi:hypothetical protein
MLFLKDNEVEFDDLLKKIGEMIGDESLQKIQSSLVYLFEEILYARYQWEKCLINEDWDLASKIFHRETIFINTLVAFQKPQLVFDIQKNHRDFTSSELKLFYNEMIEFFKKVEILIVQNNGQLPI